MAIFVISSVACALAPDPGALVAARIVQGSGAALMSPNILSILGVIYTGPARVRAVSVLGMVMGLAATCGQLLGGVLIRADVAGLGWRAIFWINVPLGLAAHGRGPAPGPRITGRAARPHGPGRRGPDHRLPDRGGAAAGRGPQAGWLAWSWAALGAAVPLAVAFAVQQRRKADRGGAPLLNPRIFAAWPLRAGLLTQTVFWCQQAAGYLVLGLYLQQGRGLSPLSAGAVFTVLAAGYLATSFRAPALTMRFGRAVIAAGALVAAAGDGALWLATAHTGTGGSVAWLFPGLLLLGAGQGLCITPLTTTVLSHADPVTAGSWPEPCPRPSRSATRSASPSPACCSSARSGTATGWPSSAACCRWGPCSWWWPR